MNSPLPVDAIPLREPSEEARRYTDLAVAVVALDERIRALQASADRLEEVLAAGIHAADAALTMLVTSLHDTNEALREAIGHGTPNPAARGTRVS